MIRGVIIRRFKRFDEVTFEIPGHVVLAGPNNTGKTTVLQAIAAWSLAFDRWKQLNNFQRRGGAYPKAPIARQAFSAVPLRTFELLWSGRRYSGSIEIQVQSTAGWAITMELVADSTEQVHVRPLPDVEPKEVREAALSTVFVPPMTGLSVEEPVYMRPKVDHLLGQAKPGEVLRNLLYEASNREGAWRALQESIQRLFGYELLPPDAKGPHILAEYVEKPRGPRYDIAGAGSGFQQVLMLLTFLNIRPASVLLLDEPDAHLHVILQDAIYGELRAVAARQKSQLIIATHSEVVIDSVDPANLCIMLRTPKLLATTEDRARLVRSLGLISNVENMLAEEAPGILYLEDYTDLDILRAWSRTLAHPAHDLLTKRLFWRKQVSQSRPGASGVSAKDHYDVLKLVREDLPGLELRDGDARPEVPDTPITGQGLQRLRWKRYEIESYLLHPAALGAFVEREVGPGDFSRQARADMIAQMTKVFHGEFLDDPFNPEPVVEAYLRTTKARTEILPPILSAAGLPNFPYTRYHEIAALMKREEIHPEVVEKLDAICKAFRL